MHGYVFRVVALKQMSTNFMVEDVRKMNENGHIKKYFDGPLKDTVPIPMRGFAVIRLLANNPGKIPPL
jgi:hypothetical protein